MKSIKAKKSLGQNFLIDENILHRIADFFDINWKNVLEVWPGYWALTEYLLEKKPKLLHLVELDKDMVHILEWRVEKKELKVEWIDFQIFHQDVLKFKPSFGNYFVIANIPYYITSPILTHFLYALSNSPQKMLIMMQREVGERILEGKLENEKWKSKRAKKSVLSLMLAKKCRVEKVVDVPRTAFHPVPKVDSIVLAFEKHHLFQETSDELFLDFIKICFSQPRKKLLNNLISGSYEKEQVLSVLKKLWIDEGTRGEELSVEVVIDLMEFINQV